MVICINRWETSGLDTPADYMEKDQLVMDFLSIPEKFRAASYYHPGFKLTQAAVWLKDKFHVSGKPIAALIGHPGSGKTYAGIAYFIQNVPVVINYGKVENCQGIIVSAYDLAELLYRKKYDALDRMKRVAWLLVDELGTEPTGWKGSDFQAHFENLFNHRYERNLKTILISNFTNEQFKEHYGERIASRLAESSLGLQVSDPDFRKERV